jgi:hypothetical protein
MSELTLGQKQRLFTHLVAQLIVHAYAEGYELTFGEAYRTPEQAKWNADKAGTGIANSLHTSRLAVDLNLFRDGKFLTTSDDHRPLGAFWKTLHPACAWGGDFRPRPDGNHYSLSHNGIR